MFWKKEYKVNDIIPNIENFEEKAKAALEYYGVYGIDITFSNSDEWAAYGYMCALSNYLNPVYAGSMATMMSGFATGKPKSCGTEEYIKEEKIEYHIIDLYNEVNKKDIPEEEKLKTIIQEIINIYTKETITTYEKAVFRVTTYINYSENEAFQRIKGSNNHEKFKNLLKIYYEHMNEKLEE